MVGGMASFSRTAKDLELKPRNVHSPGALPLLRGKTAKARVVIFFFFNYPPTAGRGRRDRRTQSIIFSFIKGQRDLRQLHRACNWCQFPPPAFSFCWSVQGCLVSTRSELHTILCAIFTGNCGCGLNNGFTSSHPCSLEVINTGSRGRCSPSLEKWVLALTYHPTLGKRGRFTN